MDRESLAAFLGRRRRELRPDDVSLPPGERRRTPGLRREEVAMLASMSVDYYTRLEQRRGPQPSTQMLSALARALQLSGQERDYLFRIAGHSAPDRPEQVAEPTPGLVRVLERLEETPAMILSALGEPLAQNAPARELFGDARGLQGWERSSIYRWFLDPALARALYPEQDRPRQSRAQVASLRAAVGAPGTRARAAELVELLRERSEEFALLWERQEVARRFEDHKILCHPQLGEMELDCQALFTEDESQVLLVLTAPDGSDGARQLERLAELARAASPAQPAGI